MSRVTKGVRELVAEAEALVDTLTADEAQRLQAEGSALLVDLRDVRELGREGKVPGAFHAPRGMLEFWIDPESPYFKDLFHAEKRFIFYCSKGWRSALATQTAQRMGLKRVCHIDGGFEAWREAGGPIKTQEKK